MRLGLGMVVFALSAGLFAETAHGSSVGFSWVRSQSGYSNDGPYNDYKTYQTSQSHWSDSRSSNYRRTTETYSAPNSWPHPEHWNDSVDKIKDWGRDSYVRWSFTWHDGRNPGKHNNSWDWCDPDQPEPPDSVGSVPVPAAAILFGSGLAFVFGVGRRRSNKLAVESAGE